MKRVIEGKGERTIFDMQLDGVIALKKYKL